MRVNTLFFAGLASLTVAFPQLRFENGIEQRSTGLHIRGAPYAPRDLRRRKVEEITITQLQDQVLSSSQLSSEVELVQLVQEKIIIIDQTKQNKDNIRKNHFANVYNTVNTVVVVVTAIIDQRDSNNKNTRYMSRKIHSNVQSREQVTIVIQESTPIIIDGGSGNGKSNGKSNGNGKGKGKGQGQSGSASPTGVSAAQSTGAVQAQVNSTVATVDPNSMSTISNSNDTMLLPAGIPVPNFGGMQVIQDPAIIIEQNQKAFVSFADQQQQQASIVDINAGGVGVTIISA